MVDLDLESSKKMIYHIGREGETIGEFDEAEFREKLFANEIVPSDWFWADGMAEWRPVSEWRAAPGMAPPISTPAVEWKLPRDLYPKKPFARLIKALAILFGAILVIGLIKSGPEKKTRGVPQVSVAASSLILLVTNTKTANWDEMVIYLNGLPPSAYKWEGRAPAIGKSIPISLSEFTKSDGERFNGFQKKVTEVWIGGDGYDYQSITFKKPAKGDSLRQTG